MCGSSNSCPNGIIFQVKETFSTHMTLGKCAHSLSMLIFYIGLHVSQYLPGIIHKMLVNLKPINLCMSIYVVLEFYVVTLSVCKPSHVGEWRNFATHSCLGTRWR